MTRLTYHAVQNWFRNLGSMLAWIVPQSKNGLQDGPRMAAALSIVMPEEYDGQHVATSQELSNHSDLKLREFIRIALYLLSNKISMHGIGNSEFHLDGKDEFMLKIFRMSGLDNVMSLRGLLSRKQDMSAGAIAESLFGSAMRCLNTKVIQLMLEAGMDPDTLITDAERLPMKTVTPLGFIAMKFRENSSLARQISALLLQHKATISLCHNGESALDIAVKHSNESMVKILISNGAHITPNSLHSAVQRNWNFMIIHYLLDAAPEGFIDHMFPEGTILVTASKQVAVVKKLLAWNANINAIQPIHSNDQFNGLGTTLLGLAAADGNMELVETLLKARAEVNIESRSGLCVPPLLLAVHRGDNDIVSLCLRAGSDVSLADRFIVPQESVERSLVERALARNGKAKYCIRMCQNLLDKGGRASQRAMEEFKALQLFDAVRLRHADSVSLLLGVPQVTAYDAKCGHNALVIAIRNGDQKIISLLQAAGATVVGCAVGSIANVKTAMFLLHIGLLHDVLNADGYAILVSAILAQDDDLTMFLLNWGADKTQLAVFPQFETPDYLCKTVLEAALSRGNFLLAETLFQRGACLGEAEIAAITWRASVINNASVLHFFLNMHPCLSLSTPTAFAIALLHRNSEIIHLLLNAGIKPSGVPMTKIYYRDSMRDLSDDVLLSRGRRILQSGLQSVLELAIDYNQPSMVPILLACGDWTKCEIGRVLTASLHRGERELAKVLLDFGGDVHQLAFARDFQARGRYPVGIALEEGDTQLLQDLVSAGLDPNRPSDGHLTGLQQAVKCGNMKHIEMLVAAGGDVNSPAKCQDGKTALQIAVQLKDTDIAEMLVRAGANVNPPLNPLNTQDECPLHLAIKSGNKKLVIFLLQVGANVNSPPSPFHGATALQLAVKQGALDLVDLFLREGADVNQAPARNGGATALQFAVIQGYIGIARKLLDAGADVNAPRASLNGRTALEGAAEWGRVDCLQLLLNEGVSVEGEGRGQFVRAVMLARANGHLAVARFLKTKFVWTDSDFEGDQDPFLAGTEEVAKVLLNIGQNCQDCKGIL